MLNVLKPSRGHADAPQDLLLLLGERWLAALTFVVAGMIAVIGFRVLFPMNDSPNLGIYSKKVDHLRRNHADYNVLFIGTSRTYRGVDPIQLQQVAEGQGCDVRAFNLGVSKLRLTELRHLQEQLSPSMLQGYDLILLSGMSLSGIAAANWGSSRIQHFSDFDGYRVSLIDIWQAPLTGLKGFLKKVQYSTLLSGSFLYRQLGIGRLADAIRGTAAGNANGPSGDLFDGDAIVDFSRHGYVALDDEPSEQFHVRGQRILNNPGYFEAMKSETQSVEALRGPIAERSWQRFDNAMQHLASFDVPIALFLPPMLPSRAEDMALAESASARGVPVLNYNRPNLYPELFEREHWFDYFHVGQSGAELLTASIGNDICPLIEQR
jgi:hypothetical protein